MSGTFPAAGQTTTHEPRHRWRLRVPCGSATGGQAYQPRHSDSLEFSKWVLDQTGVWLTSGMFFDPEGEGYVRASITVPTEKLREAMEQQKAVER